MSSILTIDQRAARTGVIVKGAAAVGFGLFMVPIVGFAIQGILGFMACAVLGVSSWAMLPAIGTVAANLRLKALKAAAEANPIETLENESLRRQEELVEIEGSVNRMRAETLGFKDDVDKFKQDYPEDTTYDEQLLQMQGLLKDLEEQYLQAAHDVQDFQDIVVKAKRKWKMSQAALKAGEATGFTPEKFLSQLKSDTALEAVQSSLNASFSQLAGTRLKSRAARQAKPAIAVHA